MTVVRLVLPPAPSREGVESPHWVHARLDQGYGRLDVVLVAPEGRGGEGDIAD